MKQQTEGKGQQQQTGKPQAKNTQAAVQNAVKGNPQPQQTTERDAQKAKAEAERTDKNKNQDADQERKPTTATTASRTKVPSADNSGRTVGNATCL